MLVLFPTCHLVVSLLLAIGAFMNVHTPKQSFPSSLTLPSISSGVKPKLDLLRTCVAAIPRILPEGMSKEDLLDLLSRLTIHMDNEIVRTTTISLTGIVTNFPAWRHNVIRIYSLFILRDIPDNCPLTLESALKFLIQMVTHWKGLITAEVSQVSDECPVCVRVGQGMYTCTSVGAIAIDIQK